MGRERVDTRVEVLQVAESTLGTAVDPTAPLMSEGMDSLSASEFVNALSSRLSIDIAPTQLFDHPTLDSIASFASTEIHDACA